MPPSGQLHPWQLSSAGRQVWVVPLPLCPGERTGDKGQREIPEQSAQGLDLDQVGENFLASKSYKQGGSELFHGVMGLGVCVCRCVFPSTSILGSKT